MNPIDTEECWELLKTALEALRNVSECTGCDTCKRMASEISGMLHLRMDLHKDLQNHLTVDKTMNS